ncbi:hypothetical protein TSUD_244040 [Trifolium subterraneum]|uniref:DUF7870 domain-containing protein n=1 Tax=Trifolium subterraneum TaxID=3900 RepID=A0A2Z6P4Q6_TRISU|nr:hypothetical protein TSUD_244040 [Trifolium subterraneum]
MAVDLAALSLGTKGYFYNKNKHVNAFAFTPKAHYLIIRLPISGTWKIFHRLVLLALFVASLPLISSSFVSRNPSSLDYSTSNMKEILPQQQLNGFDNSINMDQLLTLLFNDLTNDGLMKKSNQYKVVFLGDQEQEGFHQFQSLIDQYNMDYIPLNDVEKQNSILDDIVDLVFTSNFPASSQFIDRTLKTNGIVAVEILNADTFSKPSNYKVVYTRRFEKVVLAMKKLETKFRVGSQRKLCGYATEAKKAALQKLEDVLLEPPRAASGKSRVYLKRTKYLPNLMGDTLESYPRRVFIDVGLPMKDRGSGTNWFLKNYPTRNKNFEMYKIETVAEGSSATQVEMSDWLTKNVKDEEYVVMKAEAEVVEEMMRSKAIRLVDELFLECKPHGLNLKQGTRGRRAYWECLALYGKLRDEGVAVHQWWG